MSAYYQREIDEIREILRTAQSVVFFGGAGVSTDSGIPDFRGSGGLYNQDDQNKYEESGAYLLSTHCLQLEPKKFFNFYRNNMLYPNAQPNDTHKALAQLEEEGVLTAVVTQNIDGLHQMAGSRNVLELHGSIHRNYCRKCGKFYDAPYVKYSDGIPRCECGGTIKPDVVLYEEGLDPDVIDRSVRAISHADTLIIGGTSLVVYPAAGFIDYFRGKHLVVINKSATAREVGAELSISAPIGEILGQIEVR